MYKEASCIDRRPPPAQLEQATARQGPTRCNQRPQRWRGGVGTPRRGPAVRLAELGAVQSSAAICSLLAPRPSLTAAFATTRLVGSVSRPTSSHTLKSRTVSHVYCRGRPKSWRR